MADEIVGQEYPAKGTTYVIPKLENVADAVVAFKEYSNSIPFSEYIQTRTIADSGRAVEPVTKEDNGKMIVAVVDTTLQFGDLPEGFSVACVADSGATITYQGVDKNGQQSTQYQVATVVTVGGLNILSLASPYDGEIGGDGGGNNIALGTPPAPILVDKDGNEDTSGGSVIYFTPGVPNENQAPAIFHSAKIRRQDNADLDKETVTLDQDNMEIAVAGTKQFVDYIVDVYGINEEGKGQTASTSAFQINYNEATGGDVKEYNNYQGTGQRWRVHTFTGNGKFNVTRNINPFKVLLVAGGGSGGTWQGGGGGAGGMLEWDSTTLAKGQLDVAVGAGGAATNGTAVQGRNGGNSSITGLTAAVGGGGGGAGNGNSTTYKGKNGGSGGGGGSQAGGNSDANGGKGTSGQGTNGGNGGSDGTSWRASAGGGGKSQAGNNNGGGDSGGNGGNGKASNITNTNVTYAGGGGGCRNNWDRGAPGYGGSGGGGNGGFATVNNGQGSAGTNGKGGGGGGSGASSAWYSGKGGSGVVIVAYQIGVSTTRQIQQAQAEEAARQAGVEEGLEQGIQQGYSQAQEDLQEQLTSLRTQLSSVGTTDV